MVMDMTMQIHSAVTEGTDKTGTVVTKVAAHARRGAFAPQRADESFAQYQERLRLGRMAESERKRARRAALKTAVYDKATATMREHGTERDLAVASAVPVKDLHTRAADDVVAAFTTHFKGFSKPQNRRGTYDSFLVDEHAGPYSVWPRYQGITTRDSATIRQRLDNHSNSVSQRGTWRTARYSLKGTRMAQTSQNEHVYRAMNQAQRSKANPLLCIGTTPATVPYVSTFVSASPAPFTQTERLDHSRVSPTAGASDKMVAKHAPTQGTGKDGKPLPFTYGGSVPSIPSDMHGLWCDRSIGGIYGNGQTDIAYRPVRHADYHASHKTEYAQGIHGPWYPTVIDDSPRGVTKASLFSPRNIRFERKVSREFSELPLLCATGKQVTRPSIASVTPGTRQFAQFSISHLSPNV
jgi:hypothetical protein